MKSKFTHKEKQTILDRYLSKSESPISIIKSVELIKKSERVICYFAVGHAK